MKKIFKTFVIATVVVAAFTACNKEIEVNTPVGEQEQVFTFAIGDNSGMTKSILGSDANGRFVQFDADDSNSIGTIAPNAQGYSSVTPASGETPATFSIYTNGVVEGNTITVWYPYRTNQTDATSVELVIPAYQYHKSGNAFDMKAMPMVTKQIVVDADMVAATGSSDYTPIATINFANLGSLINFKVFSTNATYAGEKVKSITFNAKNAAGTEDANIGGTFTKNLATINPDSETTMTISSFTDGVSSIVTSPYADAAIGSDKASALDLYMVIAPGSYSGTIIVKTDVADYTYTLSEKTFVRSGVKAFGLDLNSANASRSVLDYVTLPWSYPSDWTDGSLSATSAGLNAINAVTANGLGSDYAVGNAPYQIKLDGTGDNIIVKTNTAIGSVSVRVKMLGGSTTSSITVKESVNGSDWTDVQTLTISGAQNDIMTLTTTNDFNADSRFVQLYFTKGSNVGLGGIQISDAIDWKLSSIHVGTAPTKTSYSVGQIFDPTGLVVLADYVDPNEDTHMKRNIPVTSYTYSPTSALAISDSAITISYTEGGITKTTTQPISVVQPTGWVKTDISGISAGDIFVIVGDNGDTYAMSNNNAASKAPSAVEVTIADNKITSTVSDIIKWNLSVSSEGYTFYPSGSTDTWLYTTATNDGVRVGTNDNKVFTISTEGYLQNSTTSRYVGIYNSSDWRCYTSINANITGQSFTFFKWYEDTTSPKVTRLKSEISVVAAGVSDVTENAVYQLANATNADLTVTHDNDGVVSAASAADGNVTYTVAANSGAARQGWIKIAVAGGNTIEITINQSGAAYALTIGDHENGEISAKVGDVTVVSTVVAGETVDLTATPASGFMLQAWDVYKTGESSTKVTVSSNSFVMPAYPVTVSATFTSTGGSTPPTTHYYEKVTSVAGITSGGTYLIVSNTDCALVPGTSKKLDRYTVTISDNKIESSAEVDANAVTITSSTSGYRISFVLSATTYYLEYKSSTDLQAVTNASKYWNISLDSDPSQTGGTFRIVDSSTTGRGLIYRTKDSTTTYNCFGGYSTGGVNGTQYFDIDLYKYN